MARSRKPSMSSVCAFRPVRASSGLPCVGTGVVGVQFDVQPPGVTGGTVGQFELPGKHGNIGGSGGSTGCGHRGPKSTP